MTKGKVASILSLLVVAFALTAAWSEGGGRRKTCLANGIVGAWLGTFVSPAGAKVPVVMTFNEDGTWHSTDVTDFGSGTGVELQSVMQGSWSQLGPRKITALGFGLTFEGFDDPSPGNYSGTLGVVAIASLNETLDEMSAVVTLGIWNGSQDDIPDPLGGDSPDTVLPKFELSAKRIPQIGQTASRRKHKHR